MAVKRETVSIPGLSLKKLMANSPAAMAVIRGGTHLANTGLAATLKNAAVMGIAI